MSATPLLFAALLAAGPPDAAGPDADGPPPFAYAGRVVTPAGEPAAGATVSVGWYDDGNERQAKSVTAGADGRFLLDGLPTERLAWWVLQPIYTGGLFAAPAGWGEPGAAGDDGGPPLAPGLRPPPVPLAGRVCVVGDVPLTVGTVLRGRCVGDGGEPVAGAKVTFGMVVGDVPAEIADRCEVETGPDGRFATPPLPPWLYTVTAGADGRRQVTRTLRDDGTRAESTLRPFVLKADAPGVLEVVDAAGDPVPGYELDVHEDDSGDTERTGPDGRIAVPRLSAAGFLTVRGVDPRFRPTVAPAEEVGLQPDGTRLFRLTVEPNRELQFAVTDATTGDPVRVKACVVCIWQEKDGRKRLVGCMNPRVRRLGGGRVGVPHQGAYPYHLAIAADGYETSDVYLPAIEEDATAEVGPFALVPTGEPTEPVAEVAADPGVAPEETVSTAADFLAMMRGTGGAMTIRGRVEPTGGADPAGATVTLWGPPGNRDSDPVNTRSALGRLVPAGRDCAEATVADADGRFEFTVFFPGDYLVRADAAPAAAGPGDPVRSADRPAPARQNVTVEKGDAAEVTLAPAFAGSVAGRPWKYAGVRGGALGPGWAIAFDRDGLVVAAPVAADGTFTITGLPPGEFGVKVGSPGLGDRETDFDWADFGHLLTELEEKPLAEAAAIYPGGLADWDELGLKPDPWRRASRVTVEPGATAEVVAGLSD